MVRDAAAVAEFYARAFGAGVLAKLPHSDGNRLMHCHLRIQGSNLFINVPMPEYGYPLKTPQSFTSTPRSTTPTPPGSAPSTAGAEVQNPIKLEFWGDRYGIVRDPLRHPPVDRRPGEVTRRRTLATVRLWRSSPLARCSRRACACSCGR